MLRKERKRNHIKCTIRTLTSRKEKTKIGTKNKRNEEKAVTNMVKISNTKIIEKSQIM